MKREKATDAQDLPHRYVNSDGVCSVCRTGALDARHLAWEKASAEPSVITLFPSRELGT